MEVWSLWGGLSSWSVMGGLGQNGLYWRCVLLKVVSYGMIFIKWYLIEGWSLSKWSLMEAWSLSRSLIGQSLSSWSLEGWSFSKWSNGGWPLSKWSLMKAWSQGSL